MDLTLRNWLIGGLIVDYELHGDDRAVYGEKVVATLAERLSTTGVIHAQRRDLYRYCDLYRAYPQIVESLSPQWADLLPILSVSAGCEIVETVSPLSDAPGGSVPEATATPQTAPHAIHRSVPGELWTPGKILVEKLSYSHLELLTPLEPPIKRIFYEIECIKAGWSVRELKRQIGSLYFERSSLSRDKEALSRIANEAAEAQTPVLVIRDPFVFEFLGLRPQEVLPEADLEAALLQKLQEFLLELGHGFCFEARQKRLVIGGEHFHVDLVFYHRVIKCHVLVELKVDEFRHEHLGQLNTYVGYYRANEMTDGDQPPVGLLLCTGKNHALVEYALAGMDNRLFISKYQVELPDPAQLQAYLDKQRQLLEAGRQD